MLPWSLWYWYTWVFRPIRDQAVSGRLGRKGSRGLTVEVVSPGLPVAPGSPGRFSMSQSRSQASFHTSDNNPRDAESSRSGSPAQCRCREARRTSSKVFSEDTNWTIVALRVLLPLPGIKTQPGQLCESER